MRSSSRASRSIAGGAWVLFLATAIAMPASVGATGSAANRGRGDLAYAAGVVLVGYERRISAPARGLVRRSVHAEAHRRISPLAPDLERLTLAPGVAVEDAVRALRTQKGVRFAEPDYALHLDATSNDYFYLNDYLWGLYGPGSSPASTYGSRAGEAWAAGHFGSDDVYVGIIDTGIDISHPDLAPNIWTNPFETPANGIDDDANGFVDDVHGWDFYHGDASVYDGLSDWHGTHVAGTIGAAGGNGIGVAGVSWAVTMIPAKFIQGQGFTSDAIAAIDYLTDLRTRHGLNIVATNNSWGGSEESQALVDAINRGGDAGILFVAAAGNNSDDIDALPSYPASQACDTEADGDPRGWDCLVSVAAIDPAGALADFSNYGATSVDIGAPGDDIVSTYPGAAYALSFGTSMAAPHVTGAVALLAGCQAAPSASALLDSLYDHGAATASLVGVTVTGERLDAAAMTTDCDAGGPPTATLVAPSGYLDATAATYTAWFSESVTGLDAGDFSIGGTSSGWSVDAVGGSGAGPYTVELVATTPSDGTIELTLLADAVTGVSADGPAAGISAATVVVDRTAPTTTTPGAAIRTGVALSGSKIPIRLTWTGSDAGGSGIVRYELQQSTNGGSSWSTVSTSLTSPTRDLTVPSTGSRRFRVRAVDAADHAGAWMTGPTFKPRLVQESAGAISYSSGWSSGSSGSFSGGGVRYAGAAKRKATYTFTGRGIALVTTFASNRGVVKIKVDGVTVAQIDLDKSSTAYRRLVWQRTWSTKTTHTVRIVVVGSNGRIDLDAFAVLK